MTRPAPDVRDPAEAWQERAYPQLLRGPGHRWWRSLLGAGVVVAGLGLLVLVSTAAYALAAVLQGWGPTDPALLDPGRPEGLLLTNLGLAALVPLSGLAVWLGHRWRPRWVSSVRGGLRWRWLLRCSLVAVAVAGGTSAVLLVLGGGVPSARGEDVALLLAIVLLTTPLQAAGEEYLFRGWLTQALGALLARAVAAAVVPAVVTAALFALAHGAQDPWLFADRMTFGLIASYLTRRTGGLEAAIAAHAANNVVAFVPVVLTGALGAALVTTSAPPLAVLVRALAAVLLATLLVRAARRRGVRRTFVPPGPARAALVGVEGLR